MTRTVLPLLVAVCVAAACGGTDPAAADLPEVTLFQEPIVDASDPGDRAGAAASYIRCTHGIADGGWSRDFGPSGTGSHPDQALDRFLGAGLFTLPETGFAPTGRDADRVLYTYSVGGEPKAAVIVAATSGPNGDWSVETFAACDPAEYDPSVDDRIGIDVWRDAAGNRVPTSTVRSYRGAEHCGWESVTFLVLNDDQYIRDPRHILSDVPPFRSEVTLPTDAADTGFHHDGRQPWIPDNEDEAYIVEGDSVEVWPAPTSAEPVACA